MRPLTKLIGAVAPMDRINVDTDQIIPKQFLSGNGPAYTSHRFRPFAQAMGLLPCPTPRRSPESNGLAEAFFGSLGRDYVYQAWLETLQEAQRQLPGWIMHDNHEAPHSALGMHAPAGYSAGWVVNNSNLPSQI